MPLLNCVDPSLHKQRASAFPTPVMLSHIMAVPFVITIVWGIDRSKSEAASVCFISPNTKDMLLLAVRCEAGVMSEKGNIRFY